MNKDRSTEVGIRAYIGLGANLGNRSLTIGCALKEIDRLGGVDLIGVSELRETAPLGVVDQPLFINGACVVKTTLTPKNLLCSLLGIEQKLGRVRDGVRWGPRTIDLDLLIFGDFIVNEPGLIVPHPRIHERVFVLEPLLDLAPELTLPDGRKVKEIYSTVK